MATTPNFNWSTPDNTGLVKNGALDIRTLGNSIDASLVDLKGGTTGQVLAKATNTDMDFTWTTPSAGGGGKVLQVVQASSSTATTIASTTYTDTTLSATITPSSTTSKILVQVVQIVSSQRSVSDSGGLGIRILRGATTVFTPAPATYEQMYLSIPGSNSSPTALFASVPMIYLDSPSSTSALTYKTQGAIFSTANSGTSTHQPGSSISTITLWEIGA